MYEIQLRQCATSLAEDFRANDELISFYINYAVHEVLRNCVPDIFIFEMCPR